MNEMETTGTEIVRRESGAMMTLKGVADRVNLVHQVLERVMHKGTHFGAVPGCGTKMVLLKPGADVLAMTFRLVPQFAVTRTDMENGHREYDVTCSMYGPDGGLLGQGVGSASTMEKKYRYRWEGEGRNRHKVENEDIADCYNTVLKIAKKRAHIDATLTVTGAADLFTQDLIDEDEAPRPPVEMPKAKAVKAAPQEPATDSPPAPADTVTGTLESIAPKNGKKPHGFKVDGKWHNTFSDSLADAAASLVGLPVVLGLEPNGKYVNVVSIEPADMPAEAQDGPAASDGSELPF